MTFQQPPAVRSQSSHGTEQRKSKGLTPRLFSRSKSSSRSAGAAPMRIEFRVVFRNGGVACDPFATYSDSALHAALMSALPEGMTGNLMPSTDSKGQPAVLVRAQASDINTMYELRSQVSQLPALAPASPPRPRHCLPRISLPRRRRPAHRRRRRRARSPSPPANLTSAPPPPRPPP